MTFFRRFVGEITNEKLKLLLNKAGVTMTPVRSSMDIIRAHMNYGWEQDEIKERRRKK